MIPISQLININNLETKMENTTFEIFKNCFFNTLMTTTEFSDEDLAFIFTGDIKAMWLRDSSAQVRHYLPFAKNNETLQALIESLIKRQLMYMRIDQYANSFNKEPTGYGQKDDVTDQNPWVWERKYEVDSLCYPIQLSYLYWKATGIERIFDEEFKNTLELSFDVWIREQDHSKNSDYKFMRFDCPESDTLKNEGKGTEVGYTGMTWSGFRPSDDANTYGYNIPGNMFLAVVLEYVEEIARNIYKDDMLEKRAACLKKEIVDGIEKYGIYNHKEFGKIYAYEVDGLGKYNLMDDANVPSLLSIPYIGYKSADDEIYKNTRKFILSKNNPYYYEGKYANGIGSPHTPKGYIWPIGMIMQALTSNDNNEISNIVDMLLKTHGDTGYMHESFDSDNPTEFTRSWFAWANSLFGELIYGLYQD